MSRFITSPEPRPQSLTLKDLGLGLIVVSFGVYNLGTIQRRTNTAGRKVYAAVDNAGKELGVHPRQFEAVRQIQSVTF